MDKRSNVYLKYFLRILILFLLILLGIIIYYSFSNTCKEGAESGNLTDTQKAQVQILQTQISSATLQNTTAQTNLQQAKSNKSNAELKLVNAKGNVQTSNIQLEQAQSNADAAQQKLDNANKALQQYKDAGSSAA